MVAQVYVPVTPAINPPVTEDKQMAQEGAVEVEPFSKT